MQVTSTAPNDTTHTIIIQDTVIKPIRTIIITLHFRHPSPNTLHHISLTPINQRSISQRHRINQHMSHLRIIARIEHHSRPIQMTTATRIKSHRYHITQLIHPPVRTIHQSHITVLKRGLKHGNNLITRHHQTSSQTANTPQQHHSKPRLNQTKSGQNQHTHQDQKTHGEQRQAHHPTPP